MPRYFFHIREGASLTRDRSGRELPDAEVAREEAIGTGQALIGENGTGLHRTIEIVDETGHVVDEINSRDILFHHHAYRGAGKHGPQNSPRR